MLTDATGNTSGPAPRTSESVRSTWPTGNCRGHCACMCCAVLLIEISCSPAIDQLSGSSRKRDHKYHFGVNIAPGDICVLRIVCQENIGIAGRRIKFERHFFPRLCSVGYVETMPGIFTPGITVQRTSVSCVGHSYPYPEVLEVLHDIHTRTRNFWKICMPVATIPGVRVQYVSHPLGTSVSSVRLCHNTRNFWKFCKTFVPVPGTSGSSVRSPYPHPEFFRLL